MVQLHTAVISTSRAGGVGTGRREDVYETRNSLTAPGRASDACAGRRNVQEHVYVGYNSEKDGATDL